ncbi:MAG: hypothetical protein KatS3mg087_1555 [Patescibacteria group bacterium]|nr:MAG: hypothetical protein KatS3mg087_1555 [Patescibacteria group bacterium]
MSSLRAHRLYSDLLLDYKRLLPKIYREILDEQMRLPRASDRIRSTSGLTLLVEERINNQYENLVLRMYKAELECDRLREQIRMLTMGVVPVVRQMSVLYATISKVEIDTNCEAGADDE